MSPGPRPQLRPQRVLTLLTHKRGEKNIEQRDSTGCPQKKLRLLWKAIAPLRIIVGIKVGGVSESAGADLSVEYHNFPVAQEGAEIFEFKVDKVPKLTFLNVMSGV